VNSKGWQNRASIRSRKKSSMTSSLDGGTMGDLTIGNVVGFILF